MKSAIHLLIITVMGLVLSGCDKPIKRYHPPSMSFSDEMHPLGEAIYDDDTTEVKRIMSEKGWGPNTVNEKGYSLLIYASMTSSKSVFKMLLEMGADPNKRCDVNQSYRGEDPFYSPSWALSTSMYQTDPDYVNLLLKYGADVNVGYPLHGIIDCAPGWKKIRLLRRFIKMGSDINAINERHETPLTEAISRTQMDIANQLIDWGADITIPDGDGWTPAYNIQYEFDKKDSPESRRLYIRHVQKTIERLKARGVTFPVPKPVIEGETFWQRVDREAAERKAAADSIRRDTTNYESN